MRAVDILAKKRDGAALSAAEIKWIVDEFTRGSVPDYQMSAFLMAVYLKGMTRQETVDLTLAMADSGEKLDLSDISGVVGVDAARGRVTLLAGTRLSALPRLLAPHGLRAAPVAPDRTARRHRKTLPSPR